MTATVPNHSSADFRVRRAKLYARVVKTMRARTPKEVFATIVAAGIYTKDGRLAKPYRSS